MVGFFMKKEISELIDKLEENETLPGSGTKEQGHTDSLIQTNST